MRPPANLWSSHQFAHFACHLRPSSHHSSRGAGLSDTLNLTFININSNQTDCPTRVFRTRLDLLCLLYNVSPSFRVFGASIPWLGGTRLSGCSETAPGRSVENRTEGGGLQGVASMRVVQRRRRSREFDRGCMFWQTGDARYLTCVGDTRCVVAGMPCSRVALSLSARSSRQTQSHQSRRPATCPSSQRLSLAISKRSSLTDRVCSLSASLSPSVLASPSSPLLLFRPPAPFLRLFNDTSFVLIVKFGPPPCFTSLRTLT